MEGSDCFVKPGKKCIGFTQSVSWFEFLLDPSLLQQHLSQEKPEPSPCELIIIFSSNAAGESAAYNTGEQSVAVPTRKTTALKLLALKVAASLKWDVTELEKGLSLPQQQNVLLDLINVAGVEVNIMNSTLLGVGAGQTPTQLSHKDVLNSSIIGLTPYQRFSAAVYHKWVIDVLQNAQINHKSKINNNNSNSGGLVPSSILETLLLNLEMSVSCSLSVLTALCEFSPLEGEEGWQMPTLNTFTLPSEDPAVVLQHQWDNVTDIPHSEMCAQLSYDIGKYYFFNEQYALALPLLSQCSQLLSDIKSRGGDNVYCTVDTKLLEGYLAAYTTTHLYKNQCNTIYTRYKQSIANNHAQELFNILLEDNVAEKSSIPELERCDLESRLHVEHSREGVNSRLYIHVCIANTLYSIIHQQPVTQPIHTLLHRHPSHTVLPLLDGVSKTLGSVDSGVADEIRMFVLSVSGDTQLCTHLASSPQLCNMFTSTERDFIASQSQVTKPTSITTPKPDTQGDFSLETGLLEDELLLSYSAHRIKELLHLLDSRVQKKEPVPNKNLKWVVPEPLYKVISDLPPGYHKDYSYVIVAKAQELYNVEDYVGSRGLLEVLAGELKEAGYNLGNVGFQLSALVRWEILLTELKHTLHTRKASKELALHAKTCLAIQSSGETVLPRSKVTEVSAAFLLNMGEFDCLSNLPPAVGVGPGYRHMFPVLAHTCRNINTQRIQSRNIVGRDLFDIIVPIFAGGSVPRGRALLTYSELLTFTRELQGDVVLSVLISAVTRLYNILRDEPSLEVTLQHPLIWPLQLTNASAYNQSLASEYLVTLLTQGLQLFPQNLHWIRARADYCYGQRQHAAAMRHYLEAAFISSSAFTVPVPKLVMDDTVVKHMIKCSFQLQFYTQAAVLCQFLEEVDYGSAYKYLGERWCADAGDVYYCCVWDITMLEFLIHHHAKRGETRNKQMALEEIGRLELNASNNEEIQREAQNYRKSKFLRALCHQYA